jgi:hypothetical protein
MDIIIYTIIYSQGFFKGYIDIQYGYIYYLCHMWPKQCAITIGRN